jgi:hypothetical protein
MNIPVDCLYDWIAGLGLDTIIYRFYPNGSKDPKDLKMLDHRWDDEIKNNFEKFVYRIPIICHDQEPLDFDSYEFDRDDLCKILIHQNPHIVDSISKETQRLKLIQKLNLVGFLVPSFNDKVILLHSEKNSKNLEKYQNLCVGCYWWSHAMISLDWFRFAKIDPRLSTNVKDFSFDFNVYCRAWSGSREYRLVFLSMLKSMGLFENSRISFSHYENNVHFTDHVFKNQSFSVDRSINALNDYQIPSSFSATYDTNHYNQCFIDVVLETLFDDSRLHLTEKILRPIACGKPFILAGTTGSLCYLREYGFETFGEYINEDYDLISDPLERITKIIQEMKRIGNLRPREKKHLVDQCNRIAQKNKKYFFSSKFKKRLVDELKNNLESSIEEIKSSHQNGKIYFCYKKYSSEKFYNDMDKSMIDRLVSDPNKIDLKYQLYENLIPKYSSNNDPFPFGTRID